MLKLKYEEVSTEDIVFYLKRVRGKVFKILPMSEEQDETLPIYVASLLHQISGSFMAIEGREYEKNMILEIIFSLEPFTCNHSCFSHEVYKREVFKSVGIINKIIEKEGE